MAGSTKISLTLPRALSLGWQRAISGGAANEALTAERLADWQIPKKIGTGAFASSSRSPLAWVFMQIATRRDWNDPAKYGE